MHTRRYYSDLIPAIIFLLPGLVLFGLFFLGPMLYSLRISFFEWKIVHPDQSIFVGLNNYQHALSDPIFRRAILNTLAYTVITVTAKMILGLGVALLLNQRFKGRTFFRVAYYLPVITSWVIVSLLFEYMFNGQAGLVNYILKDVLRLIPKDVLWFADPILTLVPIVLLDIWKGIGWAAIIFLAGLQAIPAELYEAARVDGADTATQLRYITWPLLGPTTAFLVVVLVIGGLNAYVPFQLMTNGGDPMDLTHSVLTLMYEATFGRIDFGYGAAISYLLTLFVFVVSLIELRLLRQQAA
ncbi:MAG TPA: sugar ABC transporter permease [Anaerolineales bacterium]|nr:sugar ABC transporter permease [Anaerolineales bacterium]